MFVSGECPVRVAAACQGPKAERARRRVAEGRSPVAATKPLNEAASRPSGQRVAAPFQAAERRPASRQRFVVRAGRRSQSRIGAKGAIYGKNFVTKILPCGGAE